MVLQFELLHVLWCKGPDIGVRLYGLASDHCWRPYDALKLLTFKSIWWTVVLKAIIPHILICTLLQTKYLSYPICSFFPSGNPNFPSVFYMTKGLFAETISLIFCYFVFILNMHENFVEGCLNKYILIIFQIQNSTFF